MGISGKVEKLIDQKKASLFSIPIIRRYSGGGSVVVDQDTLFVSFILQKKILPFACYPKPLLLWSEKLYQRALGLSELRVCENDYVIGEKKCGGNAQYIQRDRCVHHTTFLWDFQANFMQCLLYPEKTPQYRAGRSHLDFLCRMNKYLPQKETLFKALKAALKKEFLIREVPLSEVTPLLLQNYRKGTCLVTP